MAMNSNGDIYLQKTGSSSETLFNIKVNVGTSKDIPFSQVIKFIKYTYLQSLSITKDIENTSLFMRVDVDGQTACIKGDQVK